MGPIDKEMMLLDISGARLALDMEDATSENSTQGLIDIREAMRNPSKTYI